jgi:hypothetical protein
LESIKGGKFLDQLSDYGLLKKGSAPWTKFMSVYFNHVR